MAETLQQQVAEFLQQQVVGNLQQQEQQQVALGIPLQQVVGNLQQQVQQGIQYWRELREPLELRELMGILIIYLCIMQ